jgi:putative ABC transport system permease protein
MTFTSLVITNLSRRLVPSGVTMLTCGIAAFLLAVLVSIPRSIKLMTSEPNSRLRLIVTAPNAYMLPTWYASAIRTMPGVVAATTELQWYATYRDPRQPIVAYGVDPDVVKVYPEDHLTAEEVQHLNHDRRAVLVGDVLLQKYDWHLGQTISLRTPDRKLVLDFIPVAILRAKRDQNALVFRRELLDEGTKRIYGVDISGRASFIAVRVDRIQNVATVAREIDDRFHNSGYETSTITESASLTNSLAAIADLQHIILAICTVVVVTLSLIAGNAAAMNLSGRMAEVAVMRTLGFRRAQVAMLLFEESLVLASLGAACGTLVSLLLFSNGISLVAVLGAIGYMRVTAESAWASTVAVIFIATLSAIIPILQVIGGSPVENLRREL